MPGASGRRSVYIARPPAEGYEFASDPRNLPRWAAGLAQPVTIHNPMRAVPNGEGSELVFTLIPQPGMSDGQFAEDQAAVPRDLKTLKDLLERK